LNCRSALPLALFTLLTGCELSSPDEKLDQSLPDLGLEQILPKAEANAYCTADMDSELLFGLGRLLIDEDQENHGVLRTQFASEEVQMARSCLAMAAPRYTRSLCSLAMVTAERPSVYAKSEAFNYIAYAAKRNEGCAQWALYDIYNIGKLKQPPDKALAMAWLERSARHGALEAQEEMLSQSKKQNKLALAYAWARVLGDAENIEPLKQAMSPAQIAEGEQHYQQLLAQLPPQELRKKADRKELIALHMADVYMNHPQAFEGLSPLQRRQFMANVVDALEPNPDFQKRRQLYAYVLIARQANLTGPAVNLWQDPALHALLVNEKLGLEDTVARGLAILAKRNPDNAAAAGQSEAK